MIDRPRYRIIQRPSYYDPSSPIFDVQRRVLFWWEPAGTCANLDDAEQRVLHLKSAAKNTVTIKTVKEFFDD
jgi:hypothetical protein